MIAFMQSSGSMMIGWLVFFAVILDESVTDIFLFQVYRIKHTTLSVKNMRESTCIR